MRLMASRSSFSEAAYEMRIQLASPKASPVTVATIASSNRYKEKSLALPIVRPLKVLPKKDDTSGKT